MSSRRGDRAFSINLYLGLRPAGLERSWVNERLEPGRPRVFRLAAGRGGGVSSGTDLVVGVVIPDRPTGGPDPREPLFSAAAVAAEWYARRLREAPDGEMARKYLKQRGLSGEALHPLGLGFAPKGHAFLEAMGKLGISEEVLLEAGLAVRRDEDAVRPRFWGRLLFPIHDLRGRVVGFGGRVLGDGEPKYLNSPDSRIFHKGQLLYNLHHARPANPTSCVTKAATFLRFL